MPELPEVETTRLGIKPHLEGKTVESVIIRQPRLRWPIPDNLPQLLVNQSIRSVTRRGKYLLLNTNAGTAILHLGMSGHLRCLSINTELKKHDHVDIVLQDKTCLRFNDPRRFGALLWTQDPHTHPLLNNLGPEPLSDEFTTTWLYQKSRNRIVPIKTFIMDSKIVVGVGNIYANEALFYSGIRPSRKANQISNKRYGLLVEEIKNVLTNAIKQGGTTLKDFLNESGQPGYFSQQLAVYGRGGQNCLRCNQVLIETRLAGRATVYCGQCQN